MHVDLIARMLRAWQAARTGLGRLAVAEQFPDSFAAWELHHCRRLAGLRESVESFLLARMPFAEIAQSTGYPATTIDAYTVGFFDIADRLSSTSCVMHLAVEPGPHVEDPAIARHVRILSYFGGPLVAKMFLQARRASHQPRTPEELRTLAQGDVETELLAKSTIAVRLLDPSCPRARNAIWKLDVQRRRIEQRRSAQRHEVDQLNEQFRQSIRASLQTLPETFLRASTTEAAQVA